MQLVESQLLPLDVMSLVCRMWLKLHHSMLKDAPANVRQELLLALMPALQPVDAKQSLEVSQAAMQVIKAVTQLPPRPQSTKLPSALDLVTPMSAPWQPSSLAGSARHRTRLHLCANKNFWQV